MKECDIEKNMEKCNCSYEPCSRKGICCECIQYHWSMKELPACFFPDDVERTYDRSLRRFIEVYKDRGWLQKPWVSNETRAQLCTRTGLSFQDVLDFLLELISSPLKHALLTASTVNSAPRPKKLSIEKNISPLQVSSPKSRKSYHQGSGLTT